jgi:hypothetical protein
MCVKEEEKKLFPKVRQRLDVQGLGERLASRKEQLLSQAAAG